MNFADKLTNAIAEKNAPICVGLDPRLEQIPTFILDKQVEAFGQTPKAIAAALLEFNVHIIEAVKDIVPAVKPQVAFYEKYGAEGMWAYIATCKYAKEQGLLVIGDMKRNDIGSTCEAYAQGLLGKVDVFGEKQDIYHIDALTVNAYLGSDGIEPFTKQCAEHDKGIFILVKTSNESSGQLQDLPSGEIAVHEHLAEMVTNWGSDMIGESGFSPIGAVVGATYPEEARYLRGVMPHAIFLVPGYGAQGGGAEDVKPCFHQNGTGAIVNSSRGIIFAYKNSDKYGEEDYALAAREAAIKMKEDLRSVVE